MTLVSPQPENPPQLVAGPPAPLARAVALLLHGRGRDPQDMIALAERIALDDVAYVALAAPGGTWYPQSFLAPFDVNEPHLSHALARVEAVVQRLENEGTPRRRIACVGFSQGACLACEYVFRRPTRWGGLAALIGGLIGPPETEWTTAADLDGTPVLLATTEGDTWVPVERVRRTAGVFGAMRAEVDLRVAVGADHEMTADAIAATRSLLASIPSA